MNYQVSQQKFQKENRAAPKYFYKRLVELHSVVSGKIFKSNNISKQVTRNRNKKRKDRNDSVVVAENKKQKILDDNGCNNNKENRNDNNNDTIMNQLYSSNFTSPLCINNETTIPTVDN